jgi:predicted AlkP superfamily phosphohydrolase/phosphomutase
MEVSMKRGRRILAAFGVLLAATFWVSSVAAERPKVVVLGFDGADSRLVERWMDEGRLPNLARLRDEGTYAPLQPTNPPQTPVSWSSYATGTNPGKTEIFDFLKRNPDDYIPDFAMMRESRRTFLFGERNGPMLGLIGGTAIFVIGLLATLLLFRRWRARLVVSIAVALLGGGAVAVAARAYLPVEVPDAVNNRKGSTMWEVASDAGMKVQVIRVPATFPAEDVGRGHMLSGLGVPDMRGRVGTPAFYTSDPGFEAGDNQFSLELIKLEARRGRIESRVVGPRNKPFYDYVVAREAAEAEPRERAQARRDARRRLDDAGVAARVDLPLTIEATDTTAIVEVSGRTETLQVGEWSDWFELSFPVNPLVDRMAPLKGLARFKLLRLEPELELYLSPINFHPDCHPVAFSWPPDHSEELAERFGLFKTIGWALDTWSLPSGVGDENLFLEDMHFTVAKYEEMMEGLLSEGGNDLYVQIFYFTDRIGHLFWRFIDPGHPLYDAETAARYRDELLHAYERMDDLVGKARELAGDEALFIVCSDHGFSSFRRGVNYNNWLVANGLMTLKNQPTGPATLEKLFDTRQLFENVDWTKTKAYAMGLGSIYINLIGRERHGIVLPGPEYDEVRRQIKEGLESLVDPLTEERPVTRVLTREEMYGEYDANLIPDLRVNSNLNYRVSWQTSLGGFGEELIEDNLRAWSGDHCSNDPDLVRGIFFANRPINTGTPRMIDIMPTVLEALGLEPPEEVQGRPLL